ncbi:MAG TPA: hypothetical protein PKA16_09635 [Ottowia sp.]|uniref:hypothetical protein n=1 Tax=Ottowia sp. TaxID=1898956 RepID=UPI002C1AAE3A|nr:hypothetical protein [Ottowia sp.]HMN21640.1 hypothetical protein [Ottowia sp.]
MILETAVGCTRQCCAGRARQGVRAPRTPVRKDEQRRMARPAWCWRVHGPLTRQANAHEGGEINIHAGFETPASGQLRFPG